MRLFPELTLAAFVAGIGLATWLVNWPAPAGALLLIAAAGAVGAVVLRLLRLPAGPVLLATALLLGLWRAESAPAPALPIVPLGADVSATVVVTAAPYAIGNGLIRFEGSVIASDAADSDSVPSDTSLLVYARPPDDLVRLRPAPYLRYGDALRLTGRLERPEPIGDFDYAAYLESRNIPAVFWARQSQTYDVGRGSPLLAGLHRVRSALAQGLERGIPAPESGLAQALLLGVRSDLPQSVQDEFRTAGMSHLLAISGLHVGVVMALSLGIARAVFRRGSLPAAVGVALVIWGYAALSGLDPPVVRAAIMGSFVLGQTALGRGMRGVTALLLAGAIMLAIEPALIGRLSFLLSFTAMAGVILSLPSAAAASALLTAPLAASDAWPARWTQYGITLLAGSVAVSVLTTLATMPLIVRHFGVIPAMSVPATILAMPALAAALAGAGATAVVGSLLPALAVAPGLLAWAPLSWLIAIADVMPAIAIDAGWLTGITAAGWYGVLGLLVWMASSRRLLRLASARRASRRVQRWRPTGIAAALVAAVPVAVIVVVLLAAQLANTTADGRLHVYALDVGQGDAILIVTPSGRQLLIDGGPDGETTLAVLGNLLPAADRSLDAVAVTHLDSDHAGGLLDVLARYRTGAVLSGATSPDSALYPHWQSALALGGHQSARLAAGHRVALDDGIMLETLAPPGGSFPSGGFFPTGVRATANNASLVLRLTYGEVSFLLTGDIEADAERYLVAAHGSALQSDVLKVAHHGSRTSTTPAFLRAVNPQSAVISAGRDNRFGHPHSEVTERLQTAVGGGNLFLTARDGTVEYITDSVALWVKTHGPLRPGRRYTAPQTE